MLQDLEKGVGNKEWGIGEKDFACSLFPTPLVAKPNIHFFAGIVQR